MNVEITEIKISIGEDVKLSLTLNQAKELKVKLDELFVEQKPYYIQWPFTYYPPVDNPFTYPLITYSTYGNGRTDTTDGLSPKKISDINVDKS
jgi:hypothetical protein